MFYPSVLRASPAAVPIIREKDAVAMLFTGRRYGNSWYGFWSKPTKKKLEAAQKGVPEAKWALDEYKGSGKMIFMVRGPAPLVSFEVLM